MNPRHLIPTGLAVAALAFAGVGCGGSDKDSAADAGGGPGAEQTVKDYLTALGKRDGPKACGFFTDDYRDEITKQLKANGAPQGEDCAGALGAVLVTNAPRFEGEPIESVQVDTLELKSAVTQGSGEWTAKIDGPQGMAHYELVTQGGEWRIKQADAS
jgi:hypothetical protein